VGGLSFVSFVIAFRTGGSVASTTRLFGGLVVVLLSISSITSGQAGMPSTAKGDWTYYNADIKGTQVLAARSDQREQLRQARSRVAVQDRLARAAPGIQARRHAGRRERRALHDGRHATIVVALDGATGE
jgi:hypothetical protein